MRLTKKPKELRKKKSDRTHETPSVPHKQWAALRREASSVQQGALVSCHLLG